MVIVNVSVPALETVYNFSLEERAKVRDLIEEIVELISQKERIPFTDSLDSMTLGIVDTGEQCSRNACLADYGISGGADLILV